MNISGIRAGDSSTSTKSTKSKKKKEPSQFDLMLQNEIEKLKSKQDTPLYYRCMECVHTPNASKQICIKCGYCGRDFDENGHLDNIDEYPSVK